MEIIRYISRTISGSVAQLVEQKTLNLLVAGSNPARSTMKNHKLIRKDEFFIFQSELAGFESELCPGNASYGILINEESRATAESRKSSPVHHEKIKNPSYQKEGFFIWALAPHFFVIDIVWAFLWIEFWIEIIVPESD